MIGCVILIVHISSSRMCACLRSGRVCQAFCHADRLWLVLTTWLVRVLSETAFDPSTLSHVLSAAMPDFLFFLII